MFLLSLQRVIGILTFHFMEDGSIFFQSDCTFPFETLGVFLNWVSLLLSQADALHKYWCLTSCSTTLGLPSTPGAWKYSLASKCRLWLVVLQIARCSLRNPFFSSAHIKKNVSFPALGSTSLALFLAFFDLRWQVRAFADRRRSRQRGAPRRWLW